jgi:hypothetical protein
VTAAALRSCLAGCSVPAQAQPVVVRSAAPSTATSPSTAAPQPSVRVVVYLVQGERLVAVYRFAALGDGLASVLGALGQPLTPGQSSSGLRSALPTRLTGWSGHLRGAVAQVSMPAGFDRLSVPEQVLALAQLVYTVTANTYATGVELVQGAHPLAMPDQDGQLVTGPLHRADFTRLAPS